MRLTLSTKNTRALAANLYAADRRAQRAVKSVVRRNGVALHEAVRAATPVDTGFMRAALRLRFTEGGYTYEVGWDEADFTGAGLSFYPLYVIFGTRTQPANDVLFPARDRQLDVFRAELRAELRAAIRRRKAA